MKAIEVQLNDALKECDRLREQVELLRDTLGTYHQVIVLTLDTPQASTEIKAASDTVARILSLAAP